MPQSISNNNILTVKIRSPESTLFDGEAKSVSSINEKGRFDVLPQHAHFISLIRDLLVIYDQQDKLKTIKIDSGVMRVLDNKVDVFLGIETLQEKL